jgi:hypothetical protein
MRSRRLGAIAIAGIVLGSAAGAQEPPEAPPITGGPWGRTLNEGSPSPIVIPELPSPLGTPPATTPSPPPFTPGLRSITPSPPPFTPGPLPLPALPPAAPYVLPPTTGIGPVPQTGIPTPYVAPTPPLR